MNRFKIEWACLTDAATEAWDVITEYHSTREQADAVLEGFGPRPLAWVEASVSELIGDTWVSISGLAREPRGAIVELVRRRSVPWKGLPVKV